MSLADFGAAWLILERDFTPLKLQELLLKIMKDDTVLKEMAEKMRHLGQPDAAVKLAHMVEALIQG